MLSEFREFALKGNVVDLAVAVIVGAAFGKIVNSLVTNILMPPIGYVIGGVNFEDLAINMPTPTGDPVLLRYGAFLQTVFDFLIIAFVLFMVIKTISLARKRFEKEQEAAPPPAPPQSEVYLKEIRDALVQGKR
ncbi:MAG: large-conductance mechanosensitive channel protein MscL [Hyphomicrobiaceae bacterium]